jgi:hypothetical protein
MQIRNVQKVTAVGQVLFGGTTVIVCGRGSSFTTGGVNCVNCPP